MEIQVSGAVVVVAYSSSQDDGEERRKYSTLALCCPSQCASVTGPREVSSGLLGTAANTGFGEMNHAEPMFALEPNQTMTVLVHHPVFFWGNRVFL